MKWGGSAWDFPEACRPLFLFFNIRVLEVL